METHKIIIEKEGSGQRLDSYLSRHFPEPTSRTHVQGMVKGGQVLVNGAVPENHYKIKSGDVIDITIVPPPPSDITAEDIPLDIVYEDGDLIVINKSAGMTVHPAAGHRTGTLVNALLHHTGDLSSVNTAIRPGIVHRLDKDVSGLLVVAKNDEAHRMLAKQFKTRTISRKYLAFVAGVVEFDEGTIEAPIGRDRRDRKKMAVKFAEGEGKEALTKYRVKKRFADHTLLEILLGTGRTHQIRVHMAHIGHPILGDLVYNRRPDYKRIALHAARLEFIHPKTNEVVAFESPLPEDLKPLLESRK